MITKELDIIFEKLMTERNAYKEIEGETAISLNAIRQNWRRDLITPLKKAELVEKAGYEIEIVVRPKKQIADEKKVKYKKKKTATKRDFTQEELLSDQIFRATRGWLGKSKNEITG